MYRLWANSNLTKLNGLQHKIAWKNIFFNDHPYAPTAPSILNTNTSEFAKYCIIRKFIEKSFTEMKLEFQPLHDRLQAIQSIITSNSIDNFWYYRATHFVWWVPMLLHHPTLNGAGQQIRLPSSVPHNEVLLARPDSFPESYRSDHIIIIIHLYICS